MLSIQNLTLPNKKILSLELQTAEHIHVTGPNGAGKSLLLKSLSRLISSPYDQFIFQNKDLKSYDLRSYRSNVLYVSPYPFSMGATTVEDFLKAPMQLEVRRGRDSSIDENTLDFLKISKGTNFQQLSSGQKQLLTLVRAIGLEPMILLLDEPISHLDQEKIKFLISLLSNWITRTKNSLIYVSHQSVFDSSFDVKNFNID